MNITGIDHEVTLVDHVGVDRTNDGVVVISMPQQDYGKAQSKPVHPHGWGPFCHAEIDTQAYQETPGVYLLTVDGEVKYIGATKNLDQQIQRGISRISPANCFKGGQQTNCRINHKIFTATRNGDPVGLWFHETRDHRSRKQEMVPEYDPPWNRSPRSNSEPSNPNRTATEFNGKYAPLYSILDNSNTTRKEFSFEEINEILDDSLPPSAYEYPAWWRSSGGHSHAEGWEAIHWTVDTVDLTNETVTFVNERT